MGGWQGARGGTGGGLSCDCGRRVGGLRRSPDSGRTARTDHPPAGEPKTSPLPPGSAAFVVEINGRVWTARSHGSTCVAGRLSALAQPRALYELQSKGHALRAVAERTGRVAFHIASKGPSPRRPGRRSRLGSPSSSRLISLRHARHVGHGQPRPAISRPGCPGRTHLAVGLAGRRLRQGKRSRRGDHPHTGAIQTLPRSCSIGQLRRSPTPRPTACLRSRTTTASRSWTPPARTPPAASATLPECRRWHGSAAGDWHWAPATNSRSPRSAGQAYEQPSTPSAARSPLSLSHRTGIAWS